MEGELRVAQDLAEARWLAVHELGAELGGELADRVARRVHAAADAGPRLQDHHPEPAAGERAGGGEPGDARAEDDDVDGGPQRDLASARRRVPGSAVPVETGPIETAPVT